MTPEPPNDLQPSSSIWRIFGAPLGPEDECDCLVCASDLKSIVPCLREEERDQ